MSKLPYVPGPVGRSLVLTGCLAAFLVRIGRMLMSSTRMLMRLCGMLMGGGMITFVMVFSGRMMSFCCGLVGLRCFFMGGTGHLSFLKVDPQIDAVEHPKWRSRQIYSNEIAVIHFDKPYIKQTIHIKSRICILYGRKRNYTKITQRSNGALQL